MARREVLSPAVANRLRRKRGGEPPTPAAPTNTVLPSISGTLVQGQTLTASVGGWAAYPGPTFTYQWKRGGVDIGGATASTYLLVSGDVGATITVAVTATNTEGSASATSAGVGPIASVPANTVLPAISGTTAEGQTLTSTTGTWTGTPTPTYTYQWRRDGVAISGATASTYLLVTADIDATITVTVTATNSAGAVAATSTGVGPVTEAAPARTLTSVTVGAFSSGTYPVTLVGDAANGETVEWVLYSGTDPADGDEVDAGTWAGATVVDSGTFAWAASPAPITLDTGIARANYKLACIVNNGAVSNAVISTAFEVDTTASLLTDEAFTDDGAEGVDGEFTANEAVSYRASLFADGSTPTDARETGTGSVATLTGTAAAGVPETFNFPAVGDGTYVPTLWVSDDYGNEYAETYGDVTVAPVASGITVLAITNVYESSSASVTNATGSSITAAAGTDRLLLAMVTYRNNSPGPASMTVSMGAQAMTMVGVIGSTTGFIGKTQFFYLLDADIPSGSQAISATFASAVAFPVITIIELSDANQTTPIIDTVLNVSASSLTTYNASRTTTGTNSMVMTGFGLATTVDQPFTTSTNTGSVTQITAHERAGTFGQGTGCYQIIPAASTAVTHTANWTTGTQPSSRIIEIGAA